LLLLEAAVILLSWILSAVGVEGVRSLLSSEGLRWFFGDFTALLASPALVWLLLSLVALGAFQRSGLPALLRAGVLHIPSYRDRMALRVALVFLILYVGLILLLTVFPHAILLSVTGALWPSPFSRSIVAFVAFGVAMVSIAYGTMSGRMLSLADILDALAFGVSRCAPLFVVYIFLMQLLQSVRFVFA